MGINEVVRVNSDLTETGGVSVKKILRIAIAMVSLSILANADSFVVINSRADQNPTDIIDWTQLGGNGTSLTTPQSAVSFEGNNALVGNINGSSFIRLDEGNGWIGNFDSGESLIWTGAGGPAGGGAGLGPMAMVLQNPVGSFGFSIQPGHYGAFSVDVRALDASNHLLFDQTFNGISNSLENGSALFVGLGDTAGVNISEILISSTSVSTKNNFAIDDPSFTYTVATPEPRSMAVLLSALLGVAGVVRRFRK
jgi:hypothetical protein